MQFDPNNQNGRGGGQDTASANGHQADTDRIVEDAIRAFSEPDPEPPPDPAPEPPPARRPPRDVDPDPSIPDPRVTVDTFPDPAAAERAAIDFGETLVAVEPDLVLGSEAAGSADPWDLWPPEALADYVGQELSVLGPRRSETAHAGQETAPGTGLIAEREDAVTDLRCGVADAERAQMVEENTKTLTSTPTRELREISLGSAARDDLRWLESKELPRAQKQLAAEQAGLAAARQKSDEADAEVARGDGLERTPLPLDKLVWLGVLETVVNALLLQGPVAKLVTTPIPVFGPLLIAGLVGAVLSLVTFALGMALAYAIPRKAAVALLLATGCFILATRLPAHLDALRDGSPDGVRLFSDLTLLTMTASAFAGVAFFSSQAFGPVRDRQRKANTEYEEASGRLTKAEAHEDDVFADTGKQARTVSGTVGRVLGERAAGQHAGVAIAATHGVYDGMVRAERSHGELRKASAMGAWWRKRNETPAVAEEHDTAPSAAAGAVTPKATARGAVVAAVVALIAGATCGLALASAIPLAAGAVLAAGALLAGLRQPATPGDQPAEAAPDDAQGPSSLSGPRGPWVRMPTRFNQGRGTADSTSEQI